MITSKIFWQNEELVFFDKGTDSNGEKIWTFYRKSNVPENAPWQIIKEPDEYMLSWIAIKSGEKVTKQYYVTPPDKLEWWMGTYTYLPSGHYIHCDPICYGEEGKGLDVSQNATDFVLKNKDEIFTKEI